MSQQSWGLRGLPGEGSSGPWPCLSLGPLVFRQALLWRWQGSSWESLGLILAPGRKVYLTARLDLPVLLNIVGGEGRCADWLVLSPHLDLAGIWA